MVAIAQMVEHLIVGQGVTGSSPVSHPNRLGSLVVTDWTIVSKLQESSKKWQMGSSQPKNWKNCLIGKAADLKSAVTWKRIVGSSPTSSAKDPTNNGNVRPLGCVNLTWRLQGYGGGNTG